MTNEKVIMLIEAKIQPQRRAELVDAISQYVPLVRAEPGVETFYVTARKDDPNTFVFLRGLQVTCGTGFPSPTELHQEFPGHAKKRTDRRSSASRFRRVEPGRTDTFQLGNFITFGVRVETPIH
jgi:hypothetical protein